MEIKTIILILASVLSCASFYYNFLKPKKKSFHIATVKSVFPKLFMPEFALINSGDIDIIITGIRCAINTPKNGNSHFFDPKIKNENESFILMAKKVFHYKISFQNLEPRDCFKNGEETEMMFPGTTLRMVDFEVHLSWMDTTSEQHRDAIKLFRYSIDEQRNIYSMCPILKNQYNLYTKREELSVPAWKELKLKIDRYLASAKKLLSVLHHK